MNLTARVLRRDIVITCSCATRPHFHRTTGTHFLCLCPGGPSVIMCDRTRLKFMGGLDLCFYCLLNAIWGKVQEMIVFLSINNILGQLTHVHLIPS